MSDDEIVYPAPEDVLAIHEAIVRDDPDAAPGVRAPEAAESAILYVSEGYFGRSPETIHEQAVHLMRLLVADHSFVDGNKRTALNTVATFYAMDGFYFDYGDEIRDVLKGFARGDDVDVDELVGSNRSLGRPPRSRTRRSSRPSNDFERGQDRSVVTV